jgi:predicted metal-dependent phosphoesterase TrpH
VRAHIDAHVHTADSYDSAARVDDVLAAAAEAGLDGLVVTDHDAIERSRAAAKRAPDYGLVGVPGVEVSTADGHLLALGVEERPAAGHSLRASVARVRESGGVAVVPHPFQVSRHGVPRERLHDCDGVETFNAHTVTGVRNRQAGRFARREGYPSFGGSDAHRAAAVGRAYTAVETESLTADAVLDAMRAGRTRAAGRRTSLRGFFGKWAHNARLKTGVLARRADGE